MGTINYKTSDYITIGYNCNYIDHDDEYYSDDIQFFYDEINKRLLDEHFYYFHVVVEPGYYEGFSINLENNFVICHDNHTSKKEAQKEITRIKAFLLECINNYECCTVKPGWCTAYLNYTDSIKELHIAISKMRKEVKQTPTERTYYKGA